MKAGDIVQLVDLPDSGWMKEHVGRLFEVHEVFERRCLVRMLNVSNNQRYWFSEKENFAVANLAVVELENNDD